VTVQCESIEGPETLDALMTSAKLKPRILCCAPSNAAVDNVVSKIIKDRFIDGNGGKYNPSILRVGSGHSTSVSAVSLQTKIDSVLKECSNLHNLKISTEQCQVELNRIEGEIRNLQRRIRALIDSCPYRLGKGRFNMFLYVMYNRFLVTSTVSYFCRMGD
jgi:senataxin